MASNKSSSWDFEILPHGHLDAMWLCEADSGYSNACVFLSYSIHDFIMLQGSIMSNNVESIPRAFARHGIPHRQVRVKTVEGQQNKAGLQIPS